MAFSPKRQFCPHLTCAQIILWYTLIKNRVENAVLLIAQSWTFVRGILINLSCTLICFFFSMTPGLTLWHVACLIALGSSDSPMANLSIAETKMRWKRSSYSSCFEDQSLPLWRVDLEEDLHRSAFSCLLKTAACTWKLMVFELALCAKLLHGAGSAYACRASFWDRNQMISFYMFTNHVWSCFTLYQSTCLTRGIPTHTGAHAACFGFAPARNV